jgi:flavin-binding protein dodecin
VILLEKVLTQFVLLVSLLKNQRKEAVMRSDGRVARITEVVAGSPKSFDDAIVVGFKRAARTLRGITGLKVKDMRCRVEDGKIIEYRVTLGVIFILES